MKLLYALAVFAFVESALGQSCNGVNPFKAVTLDALNFVPSYSYHHIAGGLTLYENTADNGGYLYDFNSGTVYVKNADGTCEKYQTGDLQITNRASSLPALSITPALSYTDAAGVSHAGLRFSVGSLVIRNLFNGDCDGEFISFSFNDQIKWAFFYTNAEPLTDADTQKVEAALTQYQSDNCVRKCL